MRVFFQKHGVKLSNRSRGFLGPPDPLDPWGLVPDEPRLAERVQGAIRADPPLPDPAEDPEVFALEGGLRW